MNFQTKTSYPATAVFDLPEALELNRARLEHIAGLNLPLGRNVTVLDLGAGVGHLAQWFLEKDCGVMCVDARLGNIQSLRERYPGVIASTYDLESIAPSIFDSPTPDIVLCYGLLYHLENPLRAIRRMAELTGEILLLETVVLDSEALIVKYETEDAETPNQALWGYGCRPSYRLVWTALLRHFPFVTVPGPMPNHPDFDWRAKGDGAWQRDGHLLRRVFVASRKPLE